MKIFTPDPKFGWHILWIAPALWIGDLIGRPIAYFKKRAQRKRMEKIMNDPEIVELARLAGLHKRKK